MAKFLISIFSTVIQLVKTVITNIMLLKLRFKEIKQLAYISRRHWSYVPKSWALSFQSVQSFSRVQLRASPWNAAGQASLSIINSLSLLKFISIELVMPSNHLMLCCALLLPPSIFPSIRVFSNEFFATGGQSIGVWASASVLPMNIQDWFPLGWTDFL